MVLAFPWRPSRPSRLMLLLLHSRSARNDRFHDIVVAGAAAQVAVELSAPRVPRRIGMPPHKFQGGHPDARRAESAVRAVVLAEGCLHRVQFFRRADALD